MELGYVFLMVAVLACAIVLGAYAVRASRRRDT
jgi:hypothetical protein